MEADRAEFDRLAAEWRAGRGPHSSARRLAMHPAYRKIIAMGHAAVPLILAELAKKPDHWFIALHEITGADPVPESSRGRLPEMADAWVRWGREHGYESHDGIRPLALPQSPAGQSPDHEPGG